jgi:hypothetical protein
MEDENFVPSLSNSNQNPQSTSEIYPSPKNKTTKLYELLGGFFVMSLFLSLAFIVNLAFIVLLINPLNNSIDQNIESGLLAIFALVIVIVIGSVLIKIGARIMQNRPERIFGYVIHFLGVFLAFSSLGLMTFPSVYFTIMYLLMFILGLFEYIFPPLGQVISYIFFGGVSLLTFIVIFVFYFMYFRILSQNTPKENKKYQIFLIVFVLGNAILSNLGGLAFSSSLLISSIL